MRRWLYRRTSNFLMVFCIFFFLTSEANGQFIFQFYVILNFFFFFFFFFQLSDIPGKHACSEFYPCSNLVLYVVVFIQLNVLLCLSHLCDFDCTYVP